MMSVSETAPVDDVNVLDVTVAEAPEALQLL